MVNLSIIESQLATQKIGRPQVSKNELWDEIDSTNNRALKLAQEGAEHGLIVLAQSQTAGRGRHGRSWVSPHGAGLYMSVVLHPKSEKVTLPLFTLAAGLATARAVEHVANIHLGLKWVNDLVFAGRKLGGILAELSSNQTLVIGIGINISSKDVQLPEELKDKVDWLEEVAAQPIDRNLLVCQIMYELEQTSELIEAGNIDPILNGWRNYSTTLGERIRAIVGENIIEGTALDITNTGSLLVQTLSGIEELHAGEISIRKEDGSY